MLGTVWLAANYLVGVFWSGSVDGAVVNGETVTWLTVLVDVAVGAYIVAKSIRYRRVVAGVLAVSQVVLLLIFEFTLGHAIPVESDFAIDGLSVIMALVIGIVGGGICIYALGYMRDFHAHAEGHLGRQAGDAAPAAVPGGAPAASAPDAASTAPGAPAAPGAPGAAQDRRPVFFSLMFLFLSAMFGIVFFNNLGWLLCAWEVTTVCSFALIGYTRSQEAIDNSFRQIVMNLAGGLAFAVALFFLGSQGILELDQLIGTGGVGMLALPVALIAFAAMTKAAQVPFQSWLLGAMVAPTPTSALLHSSTMVKAGVFLLIKLAPCLGWSTNGIMVMFVGALTFLFCSAVAISQSNAKRVLAYSTVANLGLIVTCAGVGTPEAVWAAIFLLVFHAVAKSLLFLCVGTAEHRIESRDIEDMDNLFVRMPVLARFMALGILVMFAAPFGMLISKWATIVSLVETDNFVLLVILAFGSALTFMFWAKWLGKLLSVAQQGKRDEEGESIGEKAGEKAVHRSEWSAIALMAVLAVALSATFPFVSQYVVVPYLVMLEVGVAPFGFGAWDTGALAAIDFDNLLIMALIVLATVTVLALLFRRPRRPKGRTVPIYLGGVGLDFEKRTYRNALSQEGVASQRNWYMESWFGEGRLTMVMNTMCVTVLLFGTVCAALGLWGWSL
jgi:ech hydrogenase subunit A